MRRRRGVAAFALLAVLGAGGALWHELREPPPAAWRLLADHGGALSRIAVSLSSARRSTLRNAELVAALVNALPREVEVLALTNDAAAFDIEAGPRGHALSLVELPAALDFTIWPQDPFVVLRGPEQRRALLLSARFERADDALMADALAAHEGIELRVSELMFEGGNVLSDDQWIYLGADTVRVNAVAFATTEADIVRRFEAEFGGRVLVIGRVPQPVPHIDMMLTPLGDGHVLLADLREGTALAAAALRDDHAQVMQFEQAVANALPRSGAAGEGIDAHGESAPALPGATQHAIEAADALAIYLDELAAALREQGLEVSRVPLLLDATPLPRAAHWRGVLDYPALTYNNVLLERRAGHNVVYLPQYGFAALDRAARVTWQALGYEVRGVPGYALSALHGGALRCTVKVLARAVRPRAH